MQKDLTRGTDIRGDYALFIESSHFVGSGWDLDEEAKSFTENMGAVFFRMIENGVEQSAHGWIEDGEIVQFG